MIRFLKNVRAHALRVGDRVRYTHNDGSKTDGTVKRVDNDVIWTWIELDDGNQFGVDRRSRFELVERK